MSCTEYRPDHNGECTTCDEPAEAHALLFLNRLEEQERAIALYQQRALAQFAADATEIERLREVRLEERRQRMTHAASLERENTVLRGLVAQLHRPCHYCGLDDMSRCAGGFPGCALADDLLAGQDENFQAAVLRARDWQKVANERSARIAELDEMVAALKKAGS